LSAPPASARPTDAAAARARKQDGYDIVVGVVETHGRKETQALLDGLEIVPASGSTTGRGSRRWISTPSSRRLQIALVDELAHANAPGSRHPKRYLDIEELLHRGIDVYTTVNVQHIEPNDVVAQITHVRVRETRLTGIRPRRRHRARRPDPGRPHRAAQGGRSTFPSRPSALDHYFARN
jgi:hypothetical protein